MAPLFGRYFIPNFGWEIAYLVFALFIWTIVPLVLFVIRTKPADMGLYPNGIPTPEVTAEVEALAPASQGVSLKATLATSALWMIAVSFTTSTFTQVGVMQNQAPYLEAFIVFLALYAVRIPTILAVRHPQFSSHI